MNTLKNRYFSKKTKGLKSLRFFSLLALSILSFSAVAADFVTGGIAYNITDFENNTIEVTYPEEGNESEVSYIGEVNIPSKLTYNEVEYTITGIGEFAFKECTELTRVTLPQTLKYIGQYAFFNSSGLKEVLGCEGLEEISGYAFANCGALADFPFLPSLKYIENTAFAYCIELKECNLNDVKSIGDNAFMGCKSLKSLNFSEFGGNLCKGVFMGCTGLEEVDLSETLEDIPELTFSDCPNLKTINLPTSLKRIGNNSFTGCRSIEEIELPENLESIGSNAFGGCSGIMKLNGLDHNIELGEGAFHNLASLDSLKISDIRIISKQAFAHCRGLKYLELKGEIHNILAGAFTDCVALDTIYVSGMIAPNLSPNSFDYETEYNTILLVDADALKVFKQAAQWNRFMHIEAVEPPSNIILPELENGIILSGVYISIGSESGPITIYNLTGQTFGQISAGEEIKTIPAGIYILRGEKFVTKIKI